MLEKCWIHEFYFKEYSSKKKKGLREADIIYGVYDVGCYSSVSGGSCTWQRGVK
jgi:hypothetical protein